MSVIANRNVIDRIYEAAAVPELWLPVMEDIAQSAGCYGGTLFAVDAQRQVRSLSTEDMRHIMAVFARDGWMMRNTRAAAASAMKYPGFVVDDDLFSREQMDADPFYTEFLRRNGGGWGAGTVIDVPTGDLIVFNFERSFADGPVERSSISYLDRFRPHLARAALLSVRLGLQRAMAMTQSLAAVGLPAAVLKSSGRLLTANHLFEEMISSCFVDRVERLMLADIQADRMLQDALARLAAAVEPITGSIPIAATAISAPLIAHVVPVRGLAQDIFTQAATIVIVTPVDKGRVPESTLLQGLFDLTPAESRVAGEIGSGLAPREAAEKLGITEETARTVLKRVFSKTGVSRQSELVALLSRLTLG